MLKNNYKLISNIVSAVLLVVLLVFQLLPNFWVRTPENRDKTVKTHCTAVDKRIGTVSKDMEAVKAFLTDAEQGNEYGEMLADLAAVKEKFAASNVTYEDAVAAFAELQEVANSINTYLMSDLGVEDSDDAANAYKKAKTTSVTFVAYTKTIAVELDKLKTDAAGLQEFTWFPKDHETLQKSFENDLEGFELNDVIGMPVGVAVFTILAVAMALVKPRDIMSSIMSLIASFFGVFGYLTMPVYQMGANWTLHLIFPAIALLVSGAAVGAVAVAKFKEIRKEFIR